MDFYFFNCKLIVVFVNELPSKQLQTKIDKAPASLKRPAFKHNHKNFIDMHLCLKQTQ